MGEITCEVINSSQLRQRLGLFAADQLCKSEDAGSLGGFRRV